MAEKTKKTKTNGHAKRKELGAQELMLAIGAPYYDPIAPEQHAAWRNVPGSTPLMRMWSVMNGCTIAYGRRSPFAVDEFGSPLDMKGLAFLCEMDLPYTYLTWNKGVALGFWRGKRETDVEGDLFLCGTVRPAEVPEEQPSNQDEQNCVHTQFPAALRNRLKDYQLNDLAKLPERKKLEFLNRFNRDVHIELGAIAELTAAVRLIMDPRHDRTFEEFGIKKIREVHKRNDLTPEQAAARQKRIKALARRAKLCVDTIEAEYTPPEVVYVPQNGSVQREPARPSLYTEREQKEEEETVPTPPPHLQPPDTALVLPPPTYADFKALYPKQRLDDLKAKKAFDRLPTLQKVFCLRALRVHLTCERWIRSLADDDGSWIPMASTFITTGNGDFSADPPPYIRPAPTKEQSKAKAKAEELAERAREAYARSFPERR
jgi:hypothetical protein